MTSQMLRCLNRHSVLLISLSMIVALTMMIGVFFSTFAFFSAKEANDLAERASGSLARPVAERELDTVRTISDTIVDNASIYSFQVHAVNDRQRLVPVYGASVSLDSVTAPWHVKKLFPLLSPFFKHRESVDVEINGEIVGRATLRFHDYVRAETAIYFSFLVIFFTLLASGGCLVATRWWRRNYYHLAGLIHKEIYANHLLPSKYFSELNHYPALQRIHTLVRAKKQENSSLLDENNQLRNQIAMYQRLASKNKHDLNKVNAIEETLINTTEFDILVTLAKHLKNSIRDSEKRANAELIYHTLMSNVQGVSWNLSEYGETSSLDLLCALYQGTCYRREPRVILVPRIDVRLHYQGNMSDIMQVSNHLLDISSSNSHVGSDLSLIIERHPYSSHLMLTCRLVDPSVRNIEDHVSRVAQRRSFISFKDRLERFNARVTVKVLSDSSMDIEVVLPLLPSREMQCNHIPDFSDLHVFIVNNGARAESLHETYQRMGAAFPLVDAGSIASSPAGIYLLVSEGESYDTHLPEPLTPDDHKIIVVADTLGRAACKTKDVFATLDLHGSPHYHLEQIDLLTQRNSLAPLGDNSMDIRDGKSHFSHLMDLLPSEETEQVVWLPITLSPLALASITIPLREQGIRINEYDPSHSNPVPIENGDLVLADALTISQGGPLLPLKKSLYMVMILKEGDDTPDLEEMTSVKHVLSLPVDAGYLTSIVHRAAFLR